MTLSVSGRPVRRSAAAAPTERLCELFDQLFDAGEQLLFGARVVGEAQFQRTVETIFLGFSLDHFEHAFRIDLVRLLENEIAAARAGVDLANSQFCGPQL